MVENLKRLREPAGWTLLALLVCFMALNVVRLVWVLSQRELSVFSAFADIASNAMNLTLVVLQIALVCLCLFVAPATPRSEALARASALIVSAGTLLTAIAAGLGLWASSTLVGVVFEAVGGILDVVLKVLAVAALWVIVRAVSRGRLTVAAPEADPAPAAVTDGPPVWRPSEAAGSVWRSAADAVASAEQTPAEASVGKPTPTTGQAPPVVGRPGAAEAIGWRRVPAEPETPAS